MATFRSLRDAQSSVHWKNIYGMLAEHEGEGGDASSLLSSSGGGGVDPLVVDEDGAKAEPLVLDSSEISRIRSEMYEEVKDGMDREGIRTQTASELRDHLRLDIGSSYAEYAARVKGEAEAARAMRSKGIINDGYANPVSGVGTWIDPGMQDDVYLPVSITPTEASAYYANGGIPQRIVDKKAGAMTLSGLKFQSDELSPDDLTRLEDYAKATGFSGAFTDGITQALVFGGAVVYPVLRGDNPLATQLGYEDLLRRVPPRHFIRYWVTADRWNVVFVPDWDITARDYLFARTVFVPMGGVRVNTQRCAFIRPKKLPFWAAMLQMGWSTSEFEGWIKDYESYAIMKLSLPIMAQQSSLMYHAFPADSVLLENGADYFSEFFKENEKSMREWSILHPKAINSIGDIKILTRSYEGFREVINEARLGLCSAAGIPESILFPEQPKGLASDNQDDVELKQSEIIRILFNNVAPAFKPCIKLLVASCFGTDSEQARHAGSVSVAPDTAVVLGDTEKAALGQAFFSMVTAGVSMGLPMKNAISIARGFVPSADISKEDMEAVEDVDEDAESSMGAMGGMGGGQPGMSGGAAPAPAPQGAQGGMPSAAPKPGPGGGGSPAPQGLPKPVPSPVMKPVQGVPAIGLGKGGAA